MEFLSLQIIKQHSRLCNNEEDDIIMLYAESAEETICQLLNRGDNVSEVVASLINQYGSIPVAVIHAALLLVDNSYENRTPSSRQNSSAVDLLIKPYMKL